MIQYVHMPAKNRKTFVIIDGNAIIHRAYHALPPLTAKDGTMVNAVYGFTSMLLKVINEIKPDYLAVSFDVAGGTFRDKLFEGYKAKRVKADQELYDQIPLVHDVVRAFGIPIFEKTGFEADDVIGTITEKIKRLKDYKITSIVVSGDMDLLQLVDDEITQVLLLKKGISDMELYNEAKVKERFGFEPEFVVDYKSLRGDSSDNIPGVKGIGEKTAVELITKIGGIDEIYKKINRLKDYKISDGMIKKLEGGEKEARMSHELATIRRDVEDLNFDLNLCEVKGFDRESLVKLLQRYEFYSLVKRLPGGESTENRTTEQQNNRKQKKKVKLTTGDETNIKEIVNELKKEDVVTCKEILSGKDILNGELLGFVFVTKKGSYYIEKPGKEIFELFSNKKNTIVGHDLKSFIKVVTSYGLRVTGELFDIMIASYLLNSSTRAHDLRSIALRELGKELPAGSDQSSLFGTDPQIVADELKVVLDVYEMYKKKLVEQDDLGLFNEIEMALIPVLGEMELNGVKIDTDMMAELSKDVNHDIDKVSKKIWKEAGEEFNISSSVQLRDILFEKMDLPVDGVKKGKTGLSTAASELEKLRGIHPIVEMIEEYRELEKLRNTYIDVLPTLINKKTGRIHTTFNQAVAATGRLSSSDPNLQNIPIRTELGKKIRDAFIAEDGYVLVAADYSQIELRIVASLAQDEKMIQIFKDGEDIHKATAAVINGVPLEDVTKEMRSRAKAVNFGVLYGMGSYGLSSRTGITNWEAKDFIQKYFEQFAGVKKYLDQTLQFAKKEGYVETLFGRRRYIPELLSDNFQLRSSGERMAINMPVQGTAADLMKKAMIEVSKKINSEGVGRDLPVQNGDIKMILQVHDELVLEVKKGLENEVSKMVKEVMEGVAELRVPIEVSVAMGKRWGELK